ncbi:hypothetical protein [Nonomuraea sp. bgisy101]|uniref:hypothetical protein n=1 Tax=Nonomuraea sp. bgisy101 TaxID=3413784 RepID=UPI003D719465
MTREEQALRLVITRVLKDVLKDSDDSDRAAVREGWVTGDRLAGALGKRAVGHVQLRKGTTQATVTDQTAFEAWVVANRPEEWETVTTTVTRVRPAYLNAILTVAKKAGVAVTADGEEIPGVTVSAGEPTVAVTLSADAAELVASAWQSGELWELIGGLLPELAAGSVAEDPIAPHRLVKADG